MEHQQQYLAHEQLAFGSLLTMIAGAIDAYSYLVHGEVFAGLQTGNLILLGVNLGQGHFAGATRYLISILAFLVGTIIIRLAQHRVNPQNRVLNRQFYVLFYEMVLLVIVAITSGWITNVGSTILLSIAAAAELQEFRRLKGGPFTPLMMTGNFRTLAEAIFDGTIYHDAGARRKAGDTATIIVSFGFGASLVGLAVRWFGGATVLIPAVILLIAAGWLVFQNIRHQNDLVRE